MNRNEFQQEIDRAVERLVEEVTEIARRAAIQAMQAWFDDLLRGGHGPIPPGERGSGRST